MSTKSRHNGLSSDDRSQIRSAILSSREMLESEFERQLERYGVSDDDRVPLNKLEHLSLQERETRREIDAALERELEATEDYQRAYRNYIREATKEYLNRYVGLKTIEARGLVTETLTTKAEYGNRSYLHYTVDEIAGELTDASDDGLGVALDLAFQEIGAEIRILFEDTDYTAIEPEFTVRRDVFEELGELDDDAWAADEAIGWVYQYFGEKEREEIDDRIDNENYKVQDTDIATKTQLFTPRYIVEYLVDNSLGRMWLEMYGDDTSIDDEDNCFYLTPIEESLTDREQKDPREITVIDPACGGGHFLFYAFDVLYEMYQERTDVVESQIPREILKNNLYGIDIDPGAVQLAALALYLKAKTIEPDVTIEQLNIVSADAVLINGERKEQVLNEVELDIEERLIEQIWTSFEHVREWGSLVNIKERVEELIEEEREELEQFQKQGQARFTSDGEMTTQSSFITEQEGELSWEELKERLIDDAREVANKALEQNSVVDELFADEVAKSVELLDVLLKEYSVTVANPPYLNSSKMGSVLKQYLRSNYTGHRDIYAAFIERGVEFTERGGYTAMVTPENFMFLSSYEDIRGYILDNSQFIEGVHLSGYSFYTKDRPFTIPFVLRNSDPDDLTKSRFYRMTHKQEDYSRYNDKIQGLNKITKSLRSGKIHEDIYVINQNSIRDIRGTPIVYWFGQEILSIFDKGVAIDNVIETQSGIKSGNNDKFLRKSWEVKFDTIYDRYRPLIRSENSLKYNDQTTYLLDWKGEGKYIQEYGDEHGHQYFFGDQDLFGEECLAFKKTSRTKFTARIVSPEHLVDNQMYTVHPEDASPLFMNGLLNSSLVQYIIDGLNPTANVQQGDVLRIPYISPETNRDTIESLTQNAIDRIEYTSSMNEVALEFNPQEYVERSTTGPHIHTIFENDMVESDVRILNNLIDKHIFKEYGLSNKEKQKIQKATTEDISHYPVITNTGDLDTSRFDFRSAIPRRELPEREYQELVSKVDDLKNNNVCEISEEVGVSPYTISKIRQENNFYAQKEQEDAVGSLLSYYLGCILGRWELDGCVPKSDGIIPFSEDFQTNVRGRIKECIEITFEDPYKASAEIEKMLGSQSTQWLQNRFFRAHHSRQYRRRGQRIPIYWQLESDNGAFSCFLYYHEMDADTLPKLRGQYVDAKIDVLRNRLGSIESEFESATEDKKRKLRNEMENIQEQLDDVQDFGERLDALIDDGFEPDFEAGIWENIQKVDEYDLLQTELDKL